MSMSAGEKQQEMLDQRNTNSFYNGSGKINSLLVIKYERDEFICLDHMLNQYRDR